jgi:type I restriction enzyme M protein
VFKPYAGVKTSVLVFRRPANAPKEGRQATRRVWFYEVQNDGFDPDKIQGGGRPETPEKNDIPALLAAWAEYKASRFETPPGVEAGAVLAPGSEAPRCWWASFETIAENDFNLAASRYKPRMGEKPPDEDPAKLIREVLDMERDITNGLETLLSEVDES